MSGSETDDTPQIGSEPFDLHDDPGCGYSLARGAPKPPTQAELDRLLMYVEDIEEACKIKWGWGLKKHRGGDAGMLFVGDPVVEMHSEGIDLANYATVTMNTDHPPKKRERIHELVEKVMEASMVAVRGSRMIAEILSEED